MSNVEQRGKGDIYFLQLPPTNTIEGLSYQFVGNDGRNEQSPIKYLEEVKIGDTLVGHLPGWKPITEIPDSAAVEWVFKNAPNAILTSDLRTASQVPIKYWTKDFTIVVSTFPDPYSLENDESLLGIKKFVIEKGEKEGRKLIKYFLYKSPNRKTNG
jgi:hypothetical protein